MRSIRAYMLLILYTTLLVGYSCFHAGHALLHTLRIHVHHHHDDHRIGDHHHFFSTWFATAHDHKQENKHITIEIFPVFIFAQAFEEIPFSNQFVWLLGYGSYVQILFEEVCLAPPTPPPIN